MIGIEFVDLPSLAAQLAALSVVIETLTQGSKMTLKEVNVKVSGENSYFLSMIIGIIVAMAFGISIFDTEEPAFFYIGSALCGLISARGGNYIFDVVKSLGVVKDLKKK